MTSVNFAKLPLFKAFLPLVLSLSLFMKIIQFVSDMFAMVLPLPLSLYQHSVYLWLLW